MSDWQPLLQLLHVTALHMTAPGFRVPLPFFQFSLYLNQLSTDYADRLMTSVVPHDPFASDLLAAFLWKDIVHFGVTNMPGAVPRSASMALSASLMPYVLRLATPNWKDDPELVAGINVENGNIIYPTLQEL